MLTNTGDAVRSLLALLVLAIFTGDAVAMEREHDLQVTVSAESVQPGDVIGIVVACRCDAAPPRVRTPAGDTQLSGPFPTSEDGLTEWHGLLGIDLDTPPGLYRLVAHPPGGEAAALTLDLPVMPKMFATRELRVAPRFVEPAAAELARIQREARFISKVFRGRTSRQWLGPFTTPVEAQVSSTFGTRSIFNNRPRAPHTGVDFRAAAGVLVAAPGAGRIVLADELFYTGNTVIIDHGSGLFSMLAHLSAITVGRDETVARGALIGYVGATGRATGPHLHWGVRLGSARVDPLSLVQATRDQR